MGREPKNFRLLFSDDMARAIVQGRKTATRRPVISRANGPVINDEHVRDQDGYPDGVERAVFQRGDELMGVAFPCAPGDILIGRECWRLECTVGAGTEWAMSYRATGTTRNFSTYNDPEMGERCTDATIRSGRLWRPSIHMPDWAARIRRRVVSVTVERLHDISESDAVREGFEMGVVENYSTTARDNFSAAWEPIYAAKGLGWDSNCWVWRIEFERENVLTA